MQTVMTTNNAYDMILLIDSNNSVLSAWTATSDTVGDFLRDGKFADMWDTGQWPNGFDPDMQGDETVARELRTIDCYGTEVGRNGQIDIEERRIFWAPR